MIVPTDGWDFAEVLFRPEPDKFRPENQKSELPDHFGHEPVKSAPFQDQKISLSKKSFVKGESPPIFAEAAS